MRNETGMDNFSGLMVSITLENGRTAIDTASGFGQTDLETVIMVSGKWERAKVTVSTSWQGRNTREILWISRRKGGESKVSLMEIVLKASLGKACLKEREGMLGTMGQNTKVSLLLVFEMGREPSQLLTDSYTKESF
jgi:hypothetical protein